MTNMSSVAKNTKRTRRLVSKNELLTLVPPAHGSPSLVRVVVERGSISLKSHGTQSAFRKVSAFRLVVL